MPVEKAREYIVQETKTVATQDESIAASLGLNTQLFVFQLINFALVAAIVWWLILKPLVKKMEERKKMIDESVDNAKAIETNLQMSEKKYQEKIDEAKVRANQVMEKSYAEAESLTKGLREKARVDIRLLVEQAKKNIEIDKQEMKAEIREETAALVVLAVEKLMEKKLDEKEDEKFINNILEEIKDK